MRALARLLIPNAEGESAAVLPSPIGTFSVRPHRTLPGQSELWIDDSCWASYDTAGDALRAVVRGQIGLPAWDSLRPALYGDLADGQ